MCAAAASPDEDVMRYIQVFSGDKAQHSDAANALAWMGISDVRLFDIIERRLLADYEAARTDRHEKDRVARYVRALGFSGQPKYRPTVTKFLGEPVYQRFATAALEDQPYYEKWNPVISNRATFDSKYGDDVNRVMNMLRSDDLLLKRVAAKRIYFGQREAVLLEMLAANLRAQYANTYRDERSNAVAWMVKALGSARQERYKPLIEEVAAKAPDPAVKRHARAALEAYKRKGPLPLPDDEKT